LNKLSRVANGGIIDVLNIVEPKASRLIRVVVASLISLVVAGCAATPGGSGGELPKDRKMKISELARVWSSGASRLRLNSAGNFSSSHLVAEYFSCPSADPNSGGVVERKTGSGDWINDNSNGDTTVFLKFSDGCTATFWSGQKNGNSILWTQGKDSENVIILH
jgi:hypothetical protein